VRVTIGWHGAVGRSIAGSNEIGFSLAVEGLDQMVLDLVTGRQEYLTHELRAVAAEGFGLPDALCRSLSLVETVFETPLGYDPVRHPRILTWNLSGRIQPNWLGDTWHSMRPRLTRAVDEAFAALLAEKAAAAREGQRLADLVRGSEAWVDPRYTYAEWRLRLLDELQSEANDTARLVRGLAAFSLLRSDGVTGPDLILCDEPALRQLLPGLWPAGAPLALGATPPWDHAAVMAWFLKAVSEPPETYRVRRPLRRAPQLEPAWVLRHGSTHWMPRRNGSDLQFGGFADCVITPAEKFIRDGEVRSLSPGEGLNSVALARIAALCGFSESPPKLLEVVLDWSPSLWSEAT
jgi:hypothetical protein